MRGYVKCVFCSKVWRFMKGWGLWTFAHSLSVLWRISYTLLDRASDKVVSKKYYKEKGLLAPSSIHHAMSNSTFPAAKAGSR